VKGRVWIREELCKGCRLCVAFCPRGVLELGGVPPRAKVKKLEACTGCGVCTLMCPDLCIEVERVAVSLRQ
jgi:2-oxoglutarate ferredoxin oxidoreductase subunit delta